MTIAYRLEPELSTTEFRSVLVASTLGQRRPIADEARLDAMLRNADVIVTARDGGALNTVASANA